MKNLLNASFSLVCGVLLLSFTASCGGGGGISPPAASTQGFLASIEVSPASPSVALGTTRQLTATGIYPDNTRKDITASVNWTSSDTSVVSVGNDAGSKGMATPKKAGSATIKAMYGTTSGSTTITVKSATLASIEVTPTNPSIALGTGKQLKATGIYSDNTSLDLTSSATWTSSAPSVASISDDASSKGLATSAAAGSTTITATLGSVSGSTTLTITSATLASIGVTPTDPSIALGRNEQFSATGIFTDNTVQDLTSQVEWGSGSANIATIGQDGLAAAVAAGSTTISATLASAGVTGSTTLTVTPAVLIAIDITPAIPSISVGSSQQFIATGTYSDNTTEDITSAVTWKSSNAAIATVSNAPGTTGLATSVSAGMATITAALGGVSGSTDLTVTPAKLVSIDVTPTDPSIPMGLTQQFSASGNYDDGSVQDLTSLVTWNSSTTSVATVSNAAGSNGLATPVATGLTNITASIGSISGSSLLTVTAATLTDITITPAIPQIALGTTLQFTATGTYSDTTIQDITAFVAWSSSSGTVATVSNAGTTVGLATSVGAGTTNITAALGSLTSTVTLKVTNATLSSVTITPNNATIYLGSPQQYTATGNYSDNSTQDLTAQVTWKSSNKTVAAISNASGSNGMATPIKSGSTAISATFVKAGVTVTGTTGLTVSSSAVTRIDITPASPSVKVGKTVQFKATAVYATGGSQDVTSSVNLTWSSSNKTVATVVNVPKKNKGLATGVSVGTATIKAALKNGVSGTTTLTVTQ